MPAWGARMGAGAVQRAASRLRFPQLFALLLALFVADLLIPDLIPFLDELLLGLLAALFGLWREAPGEAPKPPEKDVTPRHG